MKRGTVPHLYTPVPKPPRAVISHFSKASAKRLVFLANNAQGLKTIVTLTYGTTYPMNGRDVKRHLANFRHRLIRKFPNAGGIWFFEFQERGAPHIHILLNCRVDYRLIRQWWSEVIHDTAIEESCTQIKPIHRPNSMGAYCAKYAAKEQQKQVPEGFINPGRFWGVFGSLDRGEVCEGTCCEGGELEPVVRALRRSLHITGGGRQGYTYRGKTMMVIALVTAYGLIGPIVHLRC